uniref:Protein AF1q n=2 Tax=Chelydra serpentina TaxID=8475 RepID=A0A8C3SF16_CHESE
MLDTANSQYSSFLYWRMPIPELDLAALEGLGLTDAALYKAKGGAGKRAGDWQQLRQDVSEEEDTLLEFSSFNFWRAPIASVSAFDFDLV